MPLPGLLAIELGAGRTFAEQKIDPRRLRPLPTVGATNARLPLLPSTSKPALCAPSPPALAGLQPPYAPPRRRP